MPQAKKDMDRPGSQRRRNGKFRGMVLERLGGRTLDVELAARRTGLQDVHFLREVLFQVRHHLYTVSLSGWPGCAKVGMSRLPEGRALVKDHLEIANFTLWDNRQARFNFGAASLCGRAAWCTSFTACPDFWACRPESCLL